MALNKGNLSALVSTSADRLPSISLSKKDHVENPDQLVMANSSYYPLAYVGDK